MATIGTYTTSGAVMFKAGANVATMSDDNMNFAIKHAESAVDISSKKNFSGAYADLSENVKGALDEAASNLAAMYLINYDTSGYTSRYEAETMLDVLRDAAARNLQLLKDIDRQGL